MRYATRVMYAVAVCATGMAITAAPRGAGAQGSFTVPKLPVERYALPNGLTVILSPDHSAHVTAVDVWYHVGSKNEVPGRTGFAHLFEHVMFMGSEHIPTGVHVKTVENAGGTMNGSTWNDRTNYFESLPSNQLETALWLESDRMGFLLPALTQAKLDAQRDVVKNERRQSVDNAVFGSEDEVISAAMYPASNPYSWPVIGSMADLSAASLDDVKGFFAKYYAPTNATLIITGDIDPTTTKALVARYFGQIPAGPAITRPNVPRVTLATEKRLVLEDTRARLPQLTISWPTVGHVDADDIPLAAVARVLTNDRTSRLTKLLVYDRQLATRVSASQNGDDAENGGQFRISVTPLPSASLTEIERLVDSTLATLVSSPPSAEEVERGKNAIRVRSVLNVSSSALSKAELLGKGQTFFGDPLHYVKQVSEELAVTPADVERVVKQYLTPGRIVLSMVPAGKLDMIAQPALAYTNVTPVTAKAATPATPATSTSTKTEK